MDQERGRLILTPTGDSRVDAAIEALGSIQDLDLAERPAILDAIHDRLREILGELGDPARPAPGEPGRRGEQGQLGAGLLPRPGLPGGQRR